MSTESVYLINLTRAYLNQESITLREDVDYSALCSLAKAHNLLPVLFAVFNMAKNQDIVSEKCRHITENYFFDSVFIYETQKQSIETIYEVLTAANIQHIFFKGAILKEIYPIPECRVMGDIDILISPSSRNQAKRALISAGFACIAQNGPVYDYRKGNVLLEVHTSLIHDDVCAGEAFSDAFQNSEFDDYCGKLNDSYHFAYLIAHIAHHFRFYGAGIKLILDLAVMLKYGCVDLEFVFRKCEEANLLTFAKEILTVCKKWYGIGEIFHEDTAKTEEFLCSFGAFGNLNRNKSAVILRRDLETGKAASPFTAKVRLLFPSYQKMKNIPYIPFIEGRPWLVPYAWCYRFVYNTRNRGEFMTNTAKGLLDENAKALAEEEFLWLKEIGLD